MRSIVSLAVLALFVFPALPARANWDVKVKLTCYESIEGKIQKLRGSNTDLIAACLGVEPEDPSIADYTVTFDSDTRELHVLRRSDCVEICDISEEIGCQEATSETSSQIKHQRSCVDDLSDFGVDPNDPNSPMDVDGSMICSESDSYSFSTNEFSFKASCKGNLIGGGTPCDISFSAGKLTVCPVL